MTAHLLPDIALRRSVAYRLYRTVCESLDEAMSCVQVDSSVAHNVRYDASLVLRKGEHVERTPLPDLSMSLDSIMESLRPAIDRFIDRQWLG